MAQACKVSVAELTWRYASEDLLSSMREHLAEPLRRACKNGACGICRCRLAAGEVTYGARQPFALWDQEIAEGYILPCIAQPLTDVTLSEVSVEPSKKGRPSYG